MQNSFPPNVHDQYSNVKSYETVQFNKKKNIMLCLFILPNSNVFHANRASWKTPNPNVLN